jgi:hypothetical protein
VIARLPAFGGVRAPINVWFVPSLGLACWPRPVSMAYGKSPQTLASIDAAGFYHRRSLVFQF